VRYLRGPALQLRCPGLTLRCDGGDCGRVFLGGAALVARGDGPCLRLPRRSARDRNMGESGVGGARRPQIVAMGGGGFSMEPENLLLDRYVLHLAGVNRPRICFLPTASGDAAEYIVRFYAAFSALPCAPAHLSLFKPPSADLRAFLLGQDVIYVGGGNTKSMLALWREWDIHTILREAWRAGVILAGLSAGAICWFESGITDSIPGDLTVLPCLGFLPGSACPHYDGEAARRPAYQHFVASGQIAPGYAADDGAALHFVGTRLERVVTSRLQARAYRVERAGDTARETELEPDYLGAPGT
jgi:dipeptidase E